MTAPTTLGTLNCDACRSDARIAKPAKRGSIATYCPQCGAQAFYRSPAAVEGIISALGRKPTEPAKPSAPAPAPEPTATAKAKAKGKRGFLDFLGEEDDD